MFPFWEKVVAPVLEAAEVRRVVEIGALRGDTTQLMLDRLGPEVELHVIDPVPDFDPAEHRARFGGQYVFHRALSLDVLGDLPPMDAALVDGDHNWYTVVNELRLLARVARVAEAPLPVLVLHDVGWPYGRRDLYYAPETIPDDERQPWRRGGMRPGVRRLVPVGGLNPTLANARVEGGARNGVMTALEDFTAEHDRPLRCVVLPIYFGLAVVVEEDVLADRPALAAVLDRLETAAGKDDLLELAETTRIDALLFQHDVFFEKEKAHDRLARRYLDGVVRGLTGEPQLENEVRLAHLAHCVERGTAPDPDRLRDPARHDAEALRRLREARRTGAEADPPASPGSTYSPLGRVGLERLLTCLETVRTDHVRGDVVVCGAGRGGSAVLARAYLEAYGLDDRTVWVADAFQPTATPDAGPSALLADPGADLNQVRDALDRFALLDDRTRFLPGDLDATLPVAPLRSVAAVVVGATAGAAAGPALDILAPLLSAGAFVVVDDTSDPAVAAAVRTHRERHGETTTEERLGHHGLVWRRGDVPLPPRRSAPSRPGASAAPLAPHVSVGTGRDLSVVVVVHDMAREAERSLHALSRSYQQGVDEVDYEVVVVENGSPAGGRVGRQRVERLGPEFRYIDMGDDAPSSPVPALNRGIAESGGATLALMIDGAHVVTPGVLREGLAGLRAYAPAVVATQGWYVGPGQQGETVRAGYDEEAEDALFERIGWPADGYRLFEIGHFEGGRDWLDGMWESNCLFAPRALLEQVGGFDQGFDEAGGGYANLDLFERLAGAPDVALVTILGEGSFHQVHGGTTTNQADPDQRRDRVVRHRHRYEELRRRPFSGPRTPVHYVGRFSTDAAARTRARRMTARAFPVDPALEGEDGPPGPSLPVADDLRDAFVRSYWNSGAWRRTRWLGHTVPVAPTDLITYQEIVTDVGPDWIVETHAQGGGRALFLATVCEALGHGQVVSVDPGATADRPSHPRISYVDGEATDATTRARVHELVGPDASAVLVVGRRGRRRATRQELDAYLDLVPVGSYAIVEHTVLDGHPVDATFGPGPLEAVRRLLNQRGRLVADTRREGHALSFNLGGYLRRVR